MWRLKCALCFFMRSLWIFIWDGLARGRSHRFTLCKDMLHPSLRGKIQIKLHLGIRSSCGPFFSNDVCLVGCMRVGVGHTKAKSAMCYPVPVHSLMRKTGKQISAMHSPLGLLWMKQWLCFTLLGPNASQKLQRGGTSLAPSREYSPQGQGRHGSWSYQVLDSGSLL